MITCTRKRLVQIQSNPKCTAITPSTGTAAGGTAITNLAGTDFQVGLTVAFIGANGVEVPATSIVRSSATQVTCVTPAVAAGAAKCLLRNRDGSVSTVAFTFT